MWRKVNKIEGVSAGAILELTAEVAQVQQAVKSGQRPAKIQKTTAGDISSSNKGIDERIKRDRLQLKGETKPLSAQIEASHQKLQEKERVYDKFVRGEVLEGDHKRKEEDQLIDFEQKAFMQAKGLMPPDEPQFYHHDIAQENERRAWEESALQDDDDDIERQRKGEQRKILNQLIEETKEGREKHKSFQMKRQQVLEQRRQAIRQKGLARQAQQQANASNNNNNNNSANSTGAESNGADADSTSDKKTNRLQLKTNAKK